MWRRLAAPAAAALLVMAVASSLAAAELGTVRVGVLQFGTVSWELNVIEENDLDKKHGFELEVEGYGGDQATNIALLGGAVDAIVDDWLWVSRQRAEGQMLVFIPYSNAVGALMVPPDSGIEDLSALAGRTVGVAGGPLDKSWLLLQGLAEQRHGMDLAGAVEPVYGAPPLLNQKLLSGELDAVLNYWNFAARLEARGYKELIGVEEAVRALGIEHDVPQLGYVFHERWANEHPDLVKAFADASREAKEMLLTSDEEWERIRPLTKAEDDATFEALQRRFRAGVPQSWGEAERKDAAELYRLLVRLGGTELVGRANELQDGTFWPQVTY